MQISNLEVKLLPVCLAICVLVHFAESNLLLPYTLLFTLVMNLHNTKVILDNEHDLLI